MRTNITHFLVISMVLHTGVFLAARHDEPVPVMPVAPIRVTLLADMNTPLGGQTDTVISESSPRLNNPADEPRSPSADKKPAHTDTTPTDANLRASKTYTAKESDAPPARQTSKPARRAALSRADLADRLQGQLRKALLPHFSYPLLARRRGWEGTVRVGLRIEANGSLTRLHLVGSSRHDILNRAAVTSLTQVARLPDADSWLDGRHFDLVLPIEYRLVDS